MSASIYEKIENHLLRLVEGGSVKALIQLAKISEIKGDLEQAFHYYSQAMRKGSVIAEARVGVMYAHGQGVKQSLSKSRTHLMAAHEKGSLYALGHLSELKYRLKLFSEAALCSKEIYKIFEEGGLAKFTTTEDREGLAIGCFILGKCFIIKRGFVNEIKIESAEQLLKQAVLIDEIAASRLHNLMISGRL